jgi:multimeric flavodoxin WrbA
VKTVLGLTSSPRVMGNSEIMTKEIMSHAGSNNRLQILRLRDLHIEPCMACYSCKKPGKSCPRHDDMEFLFHKILEADGIIISSPVYAWGTNIGIQRVLDRVFLFSEWTTRFAHKPCVTFVTYGVPYEEGYALSALNAFAKELNLEVMETAAFLGSSPGEVLRYGRNIELAKLLGHALFDPSHKRKQRNLECPNCFSNMFKFRAEMDLPSPEVRPIGQVECAFCGRVLGLKATQVEVDMPYPNEGRYGEGIAQKLAEFHRETLQSFASGKEDVKKLTEKYRKMDVEIVSKGKKVLDNLLTNKR